MSRRTISTWTSQEILEDVLRQFPGTILLVSHDRYLVQALATHIWRVAGDELQRLQGQLRGVSAAARGRD